MEPWTGRATQGALPQNPDSMPPPHAPSTQGGTHHHQTQAAESVSPIPTRTSQPHPREHIPRDTTSCPSFRKGKPLAGPGPFNGPSKINSQEATPTHNFLRKEVIQPHLPVRLPCYDFVPITSPTFDRSP